MQIRIVAEYDISQVPPLCRYAYLYLQFFQLYLLINDNYKKLQPENLSRNGLKYLKLYGRMLPLKNTGTARQAIKLV